MQCLEGIPDSISQRTQEPLRFGFVADHPFPTRMPEV